VIAQVIFGLIAPGTAIFDVEKGTDGTHRAANLRMTAALSRAKWMTGLRKYCGQTFFAMLPRRLPGRAEEARW
jgi:hypothetical protein